jgi:ribonuclease-3
MSASSNRPSAPPDVDAVGRALGHVFGRPQLLLEALTHRSFVHERGGDARDNERLEFVGDAVVGLVAATLLHAHFPEAREGELTQRRAALVSGPALARLAAELGIGAALRLGRGEERSGGAEKPRLLAGALEACFAAVYLDGGVEAAMVLGRRFFTPLLDAQSPGALDYKTRLQERLQATGRAAPRYELVGADGPEHERAFRVALRVDGALAGEGTGRSKAEAEQQAARAALEAEASSSSTGGSP